MLISVDLSQIEVITFAYYCKDKTFTRLLKVGLDVHRYLASIVHMKPEEEVTTEERKAIKAVTFGIIYGNGPFKLSQTLSIDQNKAKEYIQMFYEEFPGAETWHKKILQTVENNGILYTPSKRVLKFTKFPAKFDWQDPNRLYYNPPDIKNWPVQSFAGDIYKLLLGQIWRMWIAQTQETKENIKLINTIHDSIMFDVHPHYQKACLDLIRQVLDNAHDLIYNQYKIDFDLPLKYEISGGKSWFDLQPLHKEETKDESSSTNASR